MRIGGFQKLTLIDFPGRVAAIVFTQGCNFRCGFCHNPELVLPHLFKEPLLTETVLDYLKDHRGRLEGVVISGGEPTTQEDLADFIARIKAMGFAVKLDTNGSHPQVLASLIKANLLDYIAMDIKTSLARYPQATGIACETAKIKESLELIIKSNIPYQLRTTVVKELCSEEDLIAIRSLIGNAHHYVLQPFVASSNLVDGQFGPHRCYTDAEMEKLKAKYES